MKGTPRPTKSLTEIADEARNNFIKINGRLLTKEEAIKIAEEIKQSVKEEEEHE